MNVSGTAYGLSGAAGTVDVSTQGINSNFTINSATDADTQGFVLSGLSFDVVGDPSPPLVANDAVVTFANSGNGYGPTTPYVTAGSISATITLGFSINSAGIISLDASTTSTNGAFPLMVTEWDKTNVGSVADPSLLGKSFTLVGSQSGGANLTISELGGGGIGIQGENSNRVDGLNYGTGDVNSTPETLTWTLNAPAGLELVLKSWSFIEGTNGDIRVSNGTTNSDFPNMTGATGTLTLPNLPLANGGSLTFKEIPGIGATTGAGIAGFTFAVTAPNAPEGFDNGSGNNLWTNATNWSPDGVPVAPSDAIINGYNVILNSAASASPDELLITNGSLTLTGTEQALSTYLNTAGQLVFKGIQGSYTLTFKVSAFNGAQLLAETVKTMALTAAQAPTLGASGTASAPVSVANAMAVLSTPATVFTTPGAWVAMPFGTQPLAASGPMALTFSAATGASLKWDSDANLKVSSAATAASLAGGNGASVTLYGTPAQINAYLTGSKLMVSGAPDAVVQIGDGVRVVHQRLQLLRVQRLRPLRDQTMADFIEVGG
jgi:hypothetical protein